MGEWGSISIRLDKESFKNRVRAIQKDLYKLSDWMEIDDGSDEEDKEKNRMFCRTVKKLDRIWRELSNLSCEGYTEEELDEVWRRSGHPSLCMNLPEDKYQKIYRIIESYLQL